MALTTIHKGIKVSSYITDFSRGENYNLIQLLNHKCTYYPLGTGARNELESYRDYINTLHCVLSEKIEQYNLLGLGEMIVLYNIYTNLEEFKGESSIRTIYPGHGKAGTKLQYDIIDDYNCYLNNLNEWSKCTTNYFMQKFCTEKQWKVMDLLTRRVPGILYI